MSPRRSRPLLIAPLIPAWAILGLFAVDPLHGTAYFLPFVVFWSLLGFALFGYIARKAIGARQATKKVRRTQ